MGIAALIVAAPSQASACSPEICHAWTSLEIAHEGPIPADGVLVLAAEYGNGWDAPMETDLAAIYVEVSAEGGEPINGVISLNQDPLAILWRADAPLMPGLTYDVVASVDNTLFEENTCAEDFLSIEGTFVTAGLGLPETAVPLLTVDEEVYGVVDGDLESLVCCDEAMPTLSFCGQPESEWFTGHCASQVENIRVRLAMSVDAEAMAANGGQIGLMGWGAGDLERSVSYGSDDCYEPSAVNFATGEVVGGEPVCVSAEAAAQLGPKAIDPSAELEGMCDGPAYTCEVEADGWNSEACTPWPGTAGETETGGETDSSSSGGGETSGETGGETTDSGGGTSVTASGSAGSEGSGSTTDDDSATTSSGADDGGGGCACDVRQGSPSDVAWLGLGLPLLWVRHRRRRVQARGESPVMNAL